jgi:NADH-quinone oxidoreductase subunit M
VVFGEVANQDVAALKDLSLREFLMLGVLALTVIWMGVYPAPFTDAMQTSVSDLLTHVANSKIPQ